MKGLYKGSELSNNDYHGEKEHLSSSNIKILLKDVSIFYKEKILGERNNLHSNAMDEGSLVHSLILEPDTVSEEFARYDGMRKAGKEWISFKASEESGKKRTIMSNPQWVRCEKVARSIKTNAAALRLLRGCSYELSLFDSIQDVPVKVRADGINMDKGYIFDIKTSGFDTDIDSFRYTVKDFGYDISAAFYTYVFEKYFGKRFDFYWIVLGKKDSSCNVYRMSDETRSKGIREIMKAIKIFKECKESGEWVDSSKAVVEKTCHEDYEILDI